MLKYLPSRNVNPTYPVVQGQSYIIHRCVVFVKYTYSRPDDRDLEKSRRTNQCRFSQACKTQTTFWPVANCCLLRSHFFLDHWMVHFKESQAAQGHFKYAGATSHPCDPESIFFAQFPFFWSFKPDLSHTRVICCSKSSSEHRHPLQLAWNTFGFRMFFTNSQEKS